MSWIRHGEFDYDSGDMAGDIQVGASASARYSNPEIPGCLVTVYMCPVAPELSYADMPECLHDVRLEEDYGNGTGRLTRPPADHWRCTHRMDAIDVQMIAEFMWDVRDLDDPGGGNGSYTHMDLELPPFSGTVEEMIAAAEAAAVSRIESFDPARSIGWDGSPF